MSFFVPIAKGLVEPIVNGIADAIVGLFGRKQEVQQERVAAHNAQMEKLAEENKKEQIRLANAEAEMKKEREKQQAEMKRLLEEMRNDQVGVQQAQQKMQEEQRRLQEKETKLAKEKADLERQQEREAALKEKRYTLRTPADLERMKREAKDKMGFKNDELNVGLTGQTGCGKSTFINGLCEFSDDDPRASKMGEVECTMESKKYLHPNIPKLALWDLPGAGTEAHPLVTYFYDKYLYMFDALVIVYDTRFKEADSDLIRQALAFGVPIVVVRNKANQALESRKRSVEHRGKKKEVMIREIIDDFRKNTVDELAKFKTRFDPNSVFVINAWALTDEDQARFQEKELMEYLLTAVRELYTRR